MGGQNEMKMGDGFPPPQLGSYKHPPTEPLTHGPAAPHPLKLCRVATPMGADMLDTSEANALVSVHKNVLHTLSPI